MAFASVQVQRWQLASQLSPGDFASPSGPRQTGAGGGAAGHPVVVMPGVVVVPDVSLEVSGWELSDVAATLLDTTVVPVFELVGTIVVLAATSGVSVTLPPSVAVLTSVVVVVPGLALPDVAVGLVCLPAVSVFILLSVVVSPPEDAVTTGVEFPGAVLWLKVT